MVPLAKAAAIATDLPDVTVGTSYGNRAWFVGKKAFAWVRPFHQADLRRFGTAAVPAGPILALRTADLRSKDALLAAATPGVFTIPHFDGYAAVLIQLDVVSLRSLRQHLTDAWLACAPPGTLAKKARRRPPTPRR